MDTWATLSGSSGMGAMSSLGAIALITLNDAVTGPLLLAKKALLSLISDGSDSPRDLFLKAFFDGDVITTVKLIHKHPELVNELYPTPTKGATPLIFAICSDQQDMINMLLTVVGADPDAPDSFMKYTPLMWAVYLDNLEIVKALLALQADPYLSPQNNKKNASTMVSSQKPEMYEYFESHNILPKAVVDENDDIFIKDTVPDDPLNDEFNLKLKLQTVNASPLLESPADPLKLDSDDESALSQNPALRLVSEFDYEKVVHEQFIKFTDSDIPSLLDYFFELRSRIAYQNNTKLPAAIVFQLLRYAHLKAESSELTEFLFSCFCARLKSVTNTTSGVVNMSIQDGTSAANAGDIVLLSYWLSVVQFLHFYLAKGGIYQSFPSFLQELVNIVRSLIAAISASINLRLNAMIDDCLLDYTNLTDVSSTLYAKDWNIFKGKHRNSENTYDDVLHMLFPPSQTDMMKPSPFRYTQVLGALDYVLKMHNIHDLLKAQTYLHVFYINNAIIFNRILALSKYCSRVRAVQIRLNLSTIEDWLRPHNFKASAPDQIGNLEKLTSKEQGFKLHNLLKENASSNAKNDPHHLQFYYKSLFHIATKQLQPTFELLQWLQVVSLLADDETFINTINQFDDLNYYQLLKVINKLYRYEVHERKVPKKLVQLIKSLVAEQGEAQIKRLPLHYMTQTNFLLKEMYIYLSPNYVFDVALPNLTEMIACYGSGIGGSRVLRGKKYQPTLPVSVIDEIDEILTENQSHNYAPDYGNNQLPFDEREPMTDADNSESNPDQLEAPPKAAEKTEQYKGHELFSPVPIPTVAAHKEWDDDDFESNPW